MIADHHMPVLPEEVARIAAVKPGERFLDCTVGFGGHSLRLAKDGASLLCLDQDLDALDYAQKRLAEYSDRCHFVHGNFKDLAEIARNFLNEEDFSGFDGILADIGVSSYQLDEAERGFSFMHSGPIDMRMDRSQGETAWDLITQLSASELADLIHRYGEDPFAKPIARAIKRWQSELDPETPPTTQALAKVIAASVPKSAFKPGHHPATRCFQALRIAVNDELGALEQLLSDAPALLNPGGRLLVITFHSLEDRAVKQAFKALTALPSSPRRGLPPPPDAPLPQFDLLTPKGIAASEEECAQNPRARSAHLRAIARKRSCDER